MVAISFILMGCGSNSKTDPVSVPNVNGFAFYNATTNLDVDSYKRYEIKFQLTYDGLPVPGTVVALQAFDNHYGYVTSHFATTDANGNGKFLYTPPAVFPEAGSMYTLKLTFAETGSYKMLTQKVNLVFNFDTDTSDGRPTTISIVYESTAEEAPYFVSRYHVHAVDAKSRLPMVGVPVSMSLINGVKVKVTQDGAGSIVNSTPISFSDNTVDFLQAGVERDDNLIIFPTLNKVDPSYLGGWNIGDVESNMLRFTETYSNTASAANLHYIIGNERRLLGRSIAVADVTAVDLETNAEGYARFDVRYDRVLAGHTVTIEAHGNDEVGQRIGIAKIVGLRWNDFSGTEGVCPNDGDTHTVVLGLSINSGDGTPIEPLIDVDIVPSSIIVKDAATCAMDLDNSILHTDDYGRIYVVVKTNIDNQVDPTGECTVSWENSASSIYYEY